MVVCEQNNSWAKWWLYGGSWGLKVDVLIDRSGQSSIAYIVILVAAA